MVRIKYNLRFVLNDAEEDMEKIKKLFILYIRTNAESIDFRVPTSDLSLIFKNTEIAVKNIIQSIPKYTYKYIVAARLTP